MRKLHLLSVTLFLFLASTQSCFSQCNPGTFQGVFNITQTTAEPTLNNTTPGGVYYLEYGLIGFTPGTSGSAGAGGTLVAVPTSQNFLAITGLTPYSSYQVYTRKFCNGTTWSANSSAYAFGTAYNCNNASVINCSQLVTLAIPSGPGAWVSIGGKEVIYKFTPPIYGTHTLYLPATGSISQVAEYYFKASSGGCTESGFTFIGSSHNSVTQSFSFGPLTSGTEYYIMVNAFSQGGISSTFRIDCPTSGCGTPTTLTTTNIGSTTATLNWLPVVGANSYDIQYRVTGAATWINTASSSATKNVSGLLSNTNYEWRVSAVCSGTPSIFSSSIFFTTAASAGLTTITTGIVSPGSFCAGLTLNVPFTTNGAANAGNVFTAQLSDASGSFVSPVNIGTLTSTGAGTISCTFPANTPNGSGYRVRIVSSNPVVTGSINPSNLGISPQVGPGSTITTSTTTFCGGVPITFNCGSITNATTYHWSSPAGSSIISGQGTQTVVVTFPTTGLTGSMAVFGSNAYCSNTNFSILGVTANPVPATPTANNATGCTGTPIILSGSPAGGIFSVTNPYVGSSTTFTYTVTNGFGCTATSAPASITVASLLPASVTPSGSVNFCAGSSITLTANTGTGISYQWYKNGVAQAGATSASYLIGNAGTYYVVETSTCGTATSNSVVVNQINNPNPTMSYTTPTTFCTPGTITFTANTFAGVTYQWQKNSIDIAGATNQAYTATTNGKYRVKESASGCTKQGQDIQVSTATSVSAVIAANGPTTFCTGGSVVLSVSNAIPNYSYQWKNNGVNISGATTSSYTATTAGTYTCYVSASCGNATSNAILVSTGGIVALVNPSGTVNICTGATVAMSANTGTGFTFQWKLNGVNISGATSANYSTTAAGNYTVAITSPCGNATSAATTVAIATLTATASPANTTICNGSAATFTANTGYNFTYQWKRAGIAIAGATSSTHANSTAGNYTVVITQGGVCSATSNIAALTVISNPNPTVTLSGPTTFCAGQSVTITANTFAGVTYQWTRNGANIAGATNQAYTATTAGQYNVKETASGCTKQMGVPVVVTVNCREEVTGDEGRGLSEVKIVPNPFGETATITISDDVDLKNTSLDVYNILGKKIKSIAVVQSQIILTKENMQPGVYILRLNSNNTTKFTTRFVVR